MKNINKIAIYAGILLSIFGTGCSKEYLEVAPTTSIRADEAFSSPERVAAALTGIYDLASNSAYMHDMILTADVKGNDVVVTAAANYNRFVTEYQFTQSYSSASAANYWIQAYRIIQTCNQFEVQIPTAPLTAAQKTAYLAETRALRAEAYFNLIKWYAKPYRLDPNAMGVPIVLLPLGPDDAPPLRSKVSEVYTQILTDMLYAETNLPASKTSVYRMNKNAIQGYLAKIYLTMGNWAEASKYAKLARAGKALPAGSALLAGFYTPTSEWIYAINVRADDNQGFLNVHSFYDPYDIGYSSFRVNDAFFNSFAANDIRREQFRVDGALPEIRLANEGFLINKFTFTGIAGATNTVLLRSADMWLVEAEAEARIGGANEGAARLALQAVQARAIPGAPLSVNTGAALINEILTERAKELYGEGHKFHDLLRTLTPIVRTATNGHWLAINLPVGDNKLVYPIPQTELNANPLLKPQQNPGYAN